MTMTNGIGKHVLFGVTLYIVAGKNLLLEHMATLSILSSCLSNVL
jgi:hypothetical protein